MDHHPNADDLLRTIAEGEQYTAKAQSHEQTDQSVLTADEEEILRKMVSLLRAGKRAVLIVEESDEKLKYMFSSATRPQALSMIGRVIEETAKRL
ncbi:MAG TPA: hypothetical protein VFA29_07850 [Candidatus Baltobacteraceae bacterium]|nr:hypothetical protein [Candidatus Baltobacteraceae bacterium]